MGAFPPLLQFMQNRPLSLRSFGAHWHVHRCMLGTSSRAARRDSTKHSLDSWYPSLTMRCMAPDTR